MTVPTNIDLPPKTRGLTAIGGAMSLIAVLLVVQIWLLSAALESFLAGKHHTALPAAIFSGLMFLVCFGLYLFVDRVDADVRHSDEDRQRCVRLLDMSVQIGAKAHSFSDPTGLLSDCHRRIEMFLGSLQHVADVIDHPLTEEARSALESALRYFRESAPKHTADEEESLFPRLRQIQDPEIENALASLDALEADHHKANFLHGEVNVLGTRCLEEHCLPPKEAAQFRQAVNKLASIYGEHIRIEDEVVFPAAKRRLSSPQQSAIANEMASRRNLRP